MAGIYIHIPFCKQACHYCDFHFSTSLRYKSELVQSLIKEMGLQKNYLAGETVDTIYLGGGTPSLLDENELNLLIETVTGQHRVSADAEITMEANPDDLNQEKLRVIKQAGVNRLSIGVQSFFDDDLQWMNRVHRAFEAEAAVKTAQDIGLDNVTIDLIYGYPLLNNEKWKHNLTKAFELDVPHISPYSMTVEPLTALNTFIKNKKQRPMDDEQSAGQFIFLMSAMQSQGFEHYEISNFCKPGHYSRHNSNYWKGVPYLGIGPSAHSYNGGSRRWNVANNAKYIVALQNDTLPAEIELLTQTDRLNEYIMISLRTMWGLDFQMLNSIAAASADEIKLRTQGFIDKEWIREKDGIIYLTPTGKLYADNIASTLFF